MRMSRKEFLSFAGLSVAALALRPLDGLVASAEGTGPDYENEAGSEVPGETPKILMLGDSITSWTAFPESLVELLTEYGVEVEFVGPYQTGPIDERGVVPVKDLGIGGYTTTAFVRELGLKKREYGRPYRPEILKFFADQNNIPDIVVLELGLNDIGSGHSEKLTKDNIISVIQFLRSKNPAVSLVLVGIPPFSYRKVKNLEAKIASANKMFGQIVYDLTSEHSRIVFAPYPNAAQASSLGLVSPLEYARQTLGGDGIHPNRLAAKSMAYSVALAILELMEIDEEKPRFISGVRLAGQVNCGGG